MKAFKVYEADADFCVLVFHESASKAKALGYKEISMAVVWESEYTAMRATRVPAFDKHANHNGHSCPWVAWENEALPEPFWNYESDE